MKVNELKILSISNLEKKLVELRKKTQEFKFSIANNQLTKVRDLRATRKEIARILTILKDKVE